MISLNASNPLLTNSFSGAHNEMMMHRNIRKMHHPSVVEPSMNFLVSIDSLAFFSLDSEVSFGCVFATPEMALSAGSRSKGTSSKESISGGNVFCYEHQSVVSFAISSMLMRSAPFWYAEYQPDPSKWVRCARAGPS